MSRGLIAAGLFLALVPAGAAQAQMMGYPGGFGGFGWNQWRAEDPASGYMAGLGSFAKGKGQYLVDKAKADQINQETVERWNKALRARQRALREERIAKEAHQNAQASLDSERVRLADGSMLNFLLDRVLDSDSLGKKAAALTLPLSATIVRDIPFESESEAISLSLNQLTAFDSWPSALRGQALTTERTALRDAIEEELAEDIRGEVTVETQNKVNTAIDALRKRFVAVTPSTSPDFIAGDNFLRTLASLSRLVHNEQFKKVIAEVENYKDGKVGDLIVFMHSFNLRFGPAKTDRQREIYRELATAFGKAIDQVGLKQDQVAAGLPQDKTGKPLVGAAHEAFQGMSWQDLDEQAKPAPK